MKSVVAATVGVLLFATSALAGEALGPAGIPQSDPFPLTAEYEADFQAAEVCRDHPADLDEVRNGEKAIYAVDGEAVMVLLDEFARRFSYDYCI